MKALIFVIALLALTMDLPNTPFVPDNEAVAVTWTRNRIGNIDFYNSSDGRMATGQQIGDTYFYNEN